MQQAYNLLYTNRMLRTRLTSQQRSRHRGVKAVRSTLAAVPSQEAIHRRVQLSLFCLARAEWRSDHGLSAFCPLPLKLPRPKRPGSTAFSLVFLFVSLFGICTGNSVHAADSLYTKSSQTWTPTSAIWSTSPSASGSQLWVEGSTAVLQSPGGAVQLNGVSPSLRSMSVSADYQLRASSTERLSFVGTDSSALFVANACTLQNKVPIFCASRLSKLGGGSLVLSGNQQRFVSELNCTEGTLICADTTSTPALWALRSTPITMSANCSTRYTGTVNAADLHCGGLSGSGTLIVNGNSTNGLVLQTLHNAESSASLQTGSNGIVFKGLDSTCQSLSASLSAVNGSLTIYGHAYNDTSSTSVLRLFGNASYGGSLNLRGGTLLLDNQTTNSASRLGTSSASSISSLGGSLMLKAHASGTTQNIGAAGNKAITLNCGLTTIAVESQSGASSRAQLGIGGPNANFSLRDNTNMVINFVGRGGTLGGSSTSDPRIVFLGSGTPFLGLGSLLANTANTGTPGFATVNGNSFATWTSNGISAASFSTISTATQLQAATTNSVLDFAPTSTQTLSANCSAAALRISPNGATSLQMASRNLVCTALMLDGTSDFALQGSGTIGNGTNTRYIYICKEGTVLSCSNPLGSTASPINKAGFGILSLNASANQLAFSSLNNINVLQGVLRVNAASVGGASSSGSAQCNINLRGGILELDGGMNFVRAIDVSATANGGSISFDQSSTNRGSGGFAAVNGNSSVSLVTAPGGSTSASLRWNDNSFIPHAFNLLLNSQRSDSRITLTNAIALDLSNSTEYVAREVYVYDNPNSSTDCARLSGVISGSSNADLVKSGPGELELSASNSYAGNTFVLKGTLRCVTQNTLPSSTALVVFGGAQVELEADQQVRDLVLEQGAELKLSDGTLFVSGTFCNKGAHIIGNGTLCFNGDSQQFIGGKLVVAGLRVANAKGLVMLDDVEIVQQLRFDQGLVYTGGHHLLLDTNATSIGASQENGWVVGELQRRVRSNSSSLLFCIGDTNNYAPCSVHLSQISHPGTLSLMTLGAKAAEVESSTLDSMKLLQRHWNLRSDSLVCASYSVLVHPDISELDNTLNVNELQAEIYDGEQWQRAAHVQPSSSGVSADSLTSFGILQLGAARCMPYQVSLQSSSAGHISPADRVQLDCGASQTYTFGVDSCAHIVDLRIDGQSMGPITSYTLANVHENHSIELLTQSDVVVPAVSIYSESSGDSICAGQPMILHAEASNVGMAHFQWTLNGQSFGADSADVILSQPGDADQIRCTVQSSLACALPSTQSSQLLVVHLRAQPSCSIDVEEGAWCPGSIKSFSTSADVASLDWTIHGAAQIVGPSHSAQIQVLADSIGPDSLQIVLQTTSIEGCVSQCSVSFIVKDTTAPVLECPSNCTLSCSADIPTAAHNRSEFLAIGGECYDLCSGDSVTVDLVEERVSGSELDNSLVIERLYSARDASSNASTALQTICIIDEITPTILCADTLRWWSTLALDSTFNALVSDNCADEIELVWSVSGASYLNGEDLLSGQYLQPGENSITWTANDGHGNSSSATTLVHVVQSGNGSLSAAEQFHRNAETTTCRYRVQGNEFDPTVNNNCPQYTVHNSLNNLSTLDSMELGVGATVITWTLSDICGSSAQCQSTVVIEDHSPPQARARDVILYLDEYGVAHLSADSINNASSDVCGQVQVTASKSVFYCSDVGQQQAQLIVIDQSANSSQCTANVLVLDTIAPRIQAHNVQVYLDSTGRAEIDVSQLDDGIHDNCSEIVATLSKSVFSCMDIGQQSIVLRVNDLSSNTATATVIVTVQDTTPPRINVVSQLSAYCVSSGCYSNVLIPVSAYDQCVSGIHIQAQEIGLPNSSIVHVAHNATNASSSYAVFQLARGVHTICFTAIDASGNSATKLCTVEVRDTTAPIVRTRSATVQLNSSGMGSLSPNSINDGSTDNCAIVSTSLSTAVFHCAHLGTNTVRLLVLDASGNSATAQAVVNVVDAIAPVARARDYTLNLSNGAASLSPQMINNASSDNCGIQSMSVSKSQFSCDDVGLNRVLLRVQDLSGNSSTAACTVTVPEPAECWISSTRSNVLYTGRSERHLFLGYGAQSAILHAHVGSSQSQSGCGSGQGSGNTGTNNASSNYQYEWSPASNLSCTNCANPVFSPSSAGHYSYTLRATNQQGCSTTSEIDFCVHDVRVSGQTGKVRLRHGSSVQSLSPVAALLHLVLHSNDRLGSAADEECQDERLAYVENDASDSVESIDAPFTPLITPSPFSESCSLSCVSNDNNDFLLRCFDVEGREVQPALQFASHQEVSLGASWPAGSYYLSIEQGIHRRVIGLLKIP